MEGPERHGIPLNPTNEEAFTFDSDDRISDSEDEAGLEDDDLSWDRGFFDNIEGIGSTGEEQVQSHIPEGQIRVELPEAVTPQPSIIPTSRALRQQRQSPGHYHRLNNGR
jgi:hypothetical protein